MIRRIIPVALIVIAVVGPLLSPHDPEAIEPSKVLAGPEWGHLLGFDSAGRDILSRLLHAYRVSLLVAVAAVLIAFLIGGALGLIAGYRGGLTDTAIMRPVDMMLAFPAFLLAILVISVVGSGSIAVIAAIAGIYIPIFARVMRAPTMTVRSHGFVDAARCRGVSSAGVMLRHVAPNAIGPAVVQASILAGIAIQIEAALSFLGFGAQPPTPSLGVMLADGTAFLEQAPWATVYPGLAIGVTVIAFLAMGDGLTGRFAIRELRR